MDCPIGWTMIQPLFFDILALLVYWFIPELVPDLTLPTNAGDDLTLWH
jgi:hypothetical protein